MASTPAHGESRIVQALDKLHEFERAPVPRERLQPWWHFAALLAGEHVAGTEFVIGALFVSWGVGTRDVLVGLLLGNLLAVLTWTFVCVPIAVQTRLTLYWYLRQIGGPITALVYNVLNAVLFCILAGCMITVSASSVRMLFGIPPQTNWYPEDIRFVILVLVLGAVVVTLAILGFKRLAQFAEVCSPWMFFMFLAGALFMLPALALHTGHGPINSFAAFLKLADESIWTGVRPDGRPPISFWHVTAFAWICNLAMHGGLSDMALFRYAKTIRCGLTSACGMFFGHYVAWICAGIMGAGTAVLLKKTMAELDAGAIAMQSLGIAGAITVVLAGWTTSNPTLYRAGLAFQAVTPGWPRWLVTLLAGAATTIVACFPFVFTKLLDFVGWYGLLLMPVGAIVFAEHWLFPLIGLTRCWVSRRGLIVNWPALASWAIGIAVALYLERTGTLHLFFLFLPIWALTIVLYIILASLAGARGVSAAPQPAAPPTPAQPATSAAPPPPARRSPLGIGFGLLTLVALCACLGIAVWMFVSGPDGYEQRVVAAKTWLLICSLVYLVSAAVYSLQRKEPAAE